MSDKISIDESHEIAGIDHKESFASSELFISLFHEGMELVKETAAYLDGPGRVEAKSLNQNGNLLYSKESMLLTTRLMQIASWLLVHRAVGEGEMTAEESRSQENRVQVNAPDAAMLEHVEELPENMGNLVRRTHALQERVSRIDEAIQHKPEQQTGQPAAIKNQLDQLSAAFNAPPVSRGTDS